MDSLKGTRSQLFAVIDSAMETGQRSQRDKLSGQAGLFAMMGGRRRARRRTASSRICRIGPTPKSSPMKRNCSASTSPAILWIAGWIRFANSPNRAATVWKVSKRARMSPSAE